MNLRDWEIINALYQLKNITKAAQQIFISQPALTARIKQIESYFGVTLILRERRGIQFTPEGEYLAEQAKEMIKQHDQIKEHILSMKDSVTGTLKIGASNYVAKYKLPKILRLFRELYPNVEYQVLTGWSEDIYKKLKDRDLHVGFIQGNYPWKGGREILFEETLCVASTNLFEWADLPSMPRIDYNTDRKLIDMIEDWWNENYDQSPYVGLRVEQVDNCKEMIINGLGYGIVPNLIIKDYPNIFIKTLLDNNEHPIIRKTWIYYHQETLSINIAKAFVDFINSIDVQRL